MTRKEAITRVLEEGKKAFENGGAFSINGITFANHLRKSNICYEYNEYDNVIVGVFITCDDIIIAHMLITDIIKVTVSDKNVLLYKHDEGYDVTYGYVNGEEVRFYEI